MYTPMTPRIEDVVVKNNKDHVKGASAAPESVTNSVVRIDAVTRMVIPV